LSEDHTGILWVKGVNGGVNLTEEEIIVNGLVSDVTFQTVVELGTKDVESDGLGKSSIIISGVSTSPCASKQWLCPLLSGASEESIGVIKEFSKSAVNYNLSPSTEEFDVPFSRGFIVAVGDLVGAGQVPVEEDTVLDGLSLIEPKVVVRGVVPESLVNWAISETSLVVFSVDEVVVRNSESISPIVNVGLEIKVFHFSEEGLVEGVDTSSKHKVVEIVGVLDAGGGFPETQVKGDIETSVFLDVLGITLSVSLSKVVLSLEELEVIFSRDSVVTFNGFRLGQVEITPETTEVIV